MMMKFLKFFLGGILMEIIPIVIIIAMAIFYVTFTPDHWGKLTLLTIIIVAWLSRKFNQRF